MFVSMYFVFLLRLVFTYSSKEGCLRKQKCDRFQKVNSQATEIVSLDKKTQLAKLVLEIRKDRKEEKAMEIEKGTQEENQHQWKGRTD